MTAFESAWSLLKMPHHGTTTDRLEEIMRDGLQPRGSFRDRDEKGNFLPWESRLYYATKPQKAVSFAMYRAEEDGRGRGEPVVLQFPDSAVNNENPTQEESFANYAYTTRTIPPDQLTVHYGPPKPPLRDRWEGNEKAQEWHAAVKDWKRQMEDMHNNRGQAE
mgnify:CR=1 FL=1